jgi:hypothetical protein
LRKRRHGKNHPKSQRKYGEKNGPKFLSKRDEIHRSSFGEVSRKRIFCYAQTNPRKRG